jgi:hypothetical protein
MLLIRVEHMLPLVVATERSGSDWSALRTCHGCRDSGPFRVPAPWFGRDRRTNSSGKVLWRGFRHSIRHSRWPLGSPVPYGSQPQEAKTACYQAVLEWRDPDSNRGHHVFSRAALAPECAAFAGDSVGSGDVAGVRAFPDFASVSPALRQTTRPLCLFVRAFHLPGATADPCDDFVVRGLASGDALDQAGVRLDVWWSPLQAVGVEEPRGEQKRRALVGVGQRVVLGEVFERTAACSTSAGYASVPPNDAKGACSADSASVMRGSAATAARSAPSR